jgi:hypothetical protein
MNTTSPSLEEFLARVEYAFRFLLSEYGFAKTTSSTALRPQPFQLRYENATTAVLVEGQSWGTAAIVSIGKKDARPEGNFELVPLWTLARLKGADHEAALHVPGQLAQIEANAVALRGLAEAALQGDFSAVEAARTYLEERVRKATRG